jgi:hypothetical protein
MAQHVAVNEEGEPGSLAGPGNHALISGCAEGSTALGHEHIRSRRSSSPAAAAAGPGFPWRLWEVTTLISGLLFDAHLRHDSLECLALHRLCHLGDQVQHKGC